ncbi:leucine-rich repeat-containing protein kinase family protein [Methylobacterium nodulans]|uniref:Serine/threonine protein kinase n=1 Tax=Methylobacterium nodulans (strain LMG 21967 / CNCM I-2342 / ORS 2060) TaxID=460265 RepID=B8IFL4_METNO|nr:leucine-rich repeat-containing protein kinase family protein [Methylobacterium nodulans]ACL57749.1 serine/threonine protein kinase [Methylobacterium nodulans ORS 2060]
MPASPSPSDLLRALGRGDLAGTRELRLPGIVSEFPREIFGLADTLELLDLSGGSLSALPHDLGRLRKLRVLFCSGTRFERLPPSLGDCPALGQIGFRSTGLRDVPAESLPPFLRWLTLTDNRIERLPGALGNRPLLQKLMLAGNRLRDLPNTLAAAPNLELLRLSANGFEALPAWLVELPRLAWLSWSGNPCEPELGRAEGAAVAWSHLECGERLGEGASGWVHRGIWRPDGEGTGRPVALKLFKGAMTSDGLPEREMAACLAAGPHPHLAGALGRVTAHPDRKQGLVMPLLPADWRVLAGPPSLESCSRDVYDPGSGLSAARALRLARGIAAAAAHLHATGLLHGDLYGHNVLWDGQAGAAVLSDFGAASALPGGSLGAALQRIEVRAFGILLGELLALIPDGDPALCDLERACTAADPSRRPLMAEVVHALNGFG